MSGEPEVKDGSGSVAVDLSSAIEAVTTQMSPLEVGSIELGEDGQIRRRADDVPLNFGFTYLGIEFTGIINTGDDAEVTLHAELGKLPFSIESSDGRRWSRHIIALGGNLPHGKLFLTDSQDMRLEAAWTPPSPRTPVSIIATITSLLLDFKPYLEILAEVLAPESQEKPAVN